MFVFNIYNNIATGACTLVSFLAPFLIFQRLFITRETLELTNTINNLSKLF